MLDAKLDGRRITGNAEVRAKVAGSALTEFEITAPPERTSPFDLASALRAVVRAHVPDLAALQPWIGTAARVKGQAIVDATLRGTLGKPEFAGQLLGYELRYDMPQYGISFRDGNLRIVGGADGLVLEEFRFTSGKGPFTASGAIGLPLERGARATPSHITWKAENLRVLNRPDLRFTVDGDGSVGFKGGRLALAGRIKVDEGYVEYRPQDETQLADDIVVVGSPRPGRGRLATSPASGVPIDLDLTVDLGDDLRFNGEGLDARLAGRVQLTSSGGGLILAKGTIQTVRGSYLAFGQKLAIERGLLIFDGPVANPSLDVVALRKNLAVEAGVEIVGTVHNPVVRLVSEPSVADTEKLSWLLTGGRSGSASAQEAAALSAAMAALVGQGGRSIPQQFADTVGLDEFSIGQRVKPSSDAVGQTVTLGKRINDRLFVAYEQGLTVAQNVLRLEYVLTRFFTLSAFAGTQSGVELGFRRSWP